MVQAVAVERAAVELVLPGLVLTLLVLTVLVLPVLMKFAEQELPAQMSSIQWCLSYRSKHRLQQAAGSRMSTQPQQPTSTLPQPRCLGRPLSHMRWLRWRRQIVSDTST